MGTSRKEYHISLAAAHLVMACDDKGAHEVDSKSRKAAVKAMDKAVKEYEAKS